MKCTKAWLGGRPLEMIPSWVDNATGLETGNVIAVEVGGTNIKVSYIQLLGGGRATTSKTYEKEIGNDYFQQTGEVLFKRIAEVIRDSGLVPAGQEVTVAMAFAYAGIQPEGLHQFIVTRISKNLTARDLIHRDIALILRPELAKVGIRVNGIFFANDTNGTHQAGAYLLPQHSQGVDTVMMGIIFGTGMNFDVRIRHSKIPKLGSLRNGQSEFMTVNMEAAQFSEVTRIRDDIDLDNESVALGEYEVAGEHLYEKQVSGQYLPRLIRIRLSKMAQETGLFQGWLESPLFMDLLSLRKNQGINDKEFLKRSLQGPDVSRIVADRSANFDAIRQLLMEKDIRSSKEERYLLHEIASEFYDRAVALAAMGIAATLTSPDVDIHWNEKQVVAADGSLILHAPQFQQRVEQNLHRMLGWKKARQIKFFLPGEGQGNGIGMAVIAVLAKLLPAISLSPPQHSVIAVTEAA